MDIHLIQHRATALKDFLITHGGLFKNVRHETGSSVLARPVGISILPTAWPRSRFDEALQLQRDYNTLYMRVASDQDWLHEVVHPLLVNEPDGFVAQLWNIFTHVRDAGALTGTVCGVFRSDYMLHATTEQPRGELKQVEMNTFSCAGSCHAQRCADAHRYLARMSGAASSASVNDSLQDCSNTSSIVSMLQSAKQIYDTSVSTSPATLSAVLMVVQPNNFNIADERPIEYGLWNANVPCYRCDWSDLLTHTTLDENRVLWFRPAIGTSAVEIGVVYYRAGYEDHEYLGDQNEIRLQCEISRAVKCPDILTHLTTLKAVQQALITSPKLETLLPAEAAQRIRATFMAMFPLNDSTSNSEAQRIVQCHEEAANYVLKPNLEGGGHNVYRESIVDFLQSLPKKDWQKFSLMRLIEPPDMPGTLMMPLEVYHGLVVSELGVLGTVIWKRLPDGTIAEVENKVAGWTFKTKPEEVDEMSVAKGFGCFDSPLLTD